MKTQFNRRIASVVIVVTSFLFLHRAFAAPAEPQNNFTIGFIGSLSSFAANYGNAVLEGAQLAVDELKNQGIHVTLRAEDDQSVTKNTVTAYEKLKHIDKVQTIIGGSWWISGIVQKAAVDHMPILSCETLYTDDAVLGPSYFILHGDLGEWVRVYEPLIKEKGWKKGAVVRFSSGFGATIAREMSEIFSREGRTFVPAIEYNDIAMADAQSIAVQLKKLKPDVVYVDAQPGGLAALLKKLTEAGMSNIGIITNMIADDVRRENMVDLSPFTNLYFTKRATYDAAFAQKFKLRYGKDPYLGSDLGYYSVYISLSALRTSDPISTIKKGLTVQGQSFSFDEHNVHAGVVSSIFRIDGSRVIPIE